MHVTTLNYQEMPWIIFKHFYFLDLIDNLIEWRHIEQLSMKSKIILFNSNKLKTEFFTCLLKEQ